MAEAVRAGPVTHCLGRSRQSPQVLPPPAPHGSLQVPPGTHHQQHASQRDLLITAIKEARRGHAHIFVSHGVAARRGGPDQVRCETRQAAGLPGRRGEITHGALHTCDAHDGAALAEVKSHLEEDVRGIWERRVKKMSGGHGRVEAPPPNPCRTARAARCALSLSRRPPDEATPLPRQLRRPARPRVLLGLDQESGDAKQIGWKRSKISLPSPLGRVAPSDGVPCRPCRPCPRSRPPSRHLKTA